MIGGYQTWMAEEVQKATRLSEITFFREALVRGHPDKPRQGFAHSQVTRGTVLGLESPSENLPSKDAARDGELGLRLSLMIEGEAPAWQLVITPELIPPYGQVSRHRPYFDAYAYRPRGALEFDLRGDAKGKGLGVAFRCTYGRGTASPRLTPLDPYLKDTADWQHVVVPVADMDFETAKTSLHTSSSLVLGGEGWAGALNIDLDSIILCSDGPEPERGPVRVDHVGYLPASRKVAVVAGSRLFGLDGWPFLVRRAGKDGRPTGAPVLRSKLKLRAAFEPKIYGEWVYEADFTPLREKGRYVIEVLGVGNSVPFFVADAIYDYLYYHLARFFFYQRNGCALPEKNAFEWPRGECYTQPTPFASDETKTKLVLHGWFDAGDSRLYPHTTRLAPMLLAWEMGQDKHFDGQLNIPESGNGIPDLLDEVRWQVEYLREMQLEDGACLGYLMTSKGYSGSARGTPITGWDLGYENDPDPRYIRDRIRYDESVRICACMAMMARVLKPYDAEGSAAFEAAALKAWDWAQQNSPAPENSTQPRWQGDILWAAVEMWRLTRQDRFHDVVHDLAETPGVWREDAFRGSTHRAWISYVLDTGGEVGLREQFRLRFVQGMEALFELVKKEPYGVSVCPQEQYHNSPGVGHVGMQLAMAWKLSGRNEFRALAEEHMHYVLGRNPYRLCSVSNVAPETYSEIYHGYEWLPGREVWMPGFMAHTSSWGNATMSRLRSRRVRMTRHTWYWGEPCVGFNYSVTAVSMLLMEGRRYDDLIRQGAFPGVKPVRPGLPFSPTAAAIPWGAEPVVPGPAE